MHLQEPLTQGTVEVHESLLGIHRSLLPVSRMTSRTWAGVPIETFTIYSIFLLMTGRSTALVLRRQMVVGSEDLLMGSRSTPSWANAAGMRSPSRLNQLRLECRILGMSNGSNGEDRARQRAANGLARGDVYRAKGGNGRSNEHGIDAHRRNEVSTLYYYPRRAAGNRASLIVN